MRTFATLLLLPLLLASCDDCDSCDEPYVPEPRLVSILVEVYDPTTNLVWENVSVRILEADQEWSQCTCVSPYEAYYLTNASGQVLVDENMLAAAQVGFLEDFDGRAILGGNPYEDEATVVLEISAVGFTPVIVEVPLSWAVPDVFVEVPFQ